MLRPPLAPNNAKSSENLQLLKSKDAMFINHHVGLVSSIFQMEPTTAEPFARLQEGHERVIPEWALHTDVL